MWQIRIVFWNCIIHISSFTYLDVTYSKHCEHWAERDAELVISYRWQLLALRRRQRELREHCNRMDPGSTWILLIDKER